MGSNSSKKNKVGDGWPHFSKWVTKIFQVVKQDKDGKGQRDGGQSLASQVVRFFQDKTGKGKAKRWGQEFGQLGGQIVSKFIPTHSNTTNLIIINQKQKLTDQKLTFIIVFIIITVEK